MTETTLLVLVLLFLGGALGVIVYFLYLIKFASNSCNRFQIERNSVIVVQLCKNNAKPPCTLLNAFDTCTITPKVIAPVNKLGPIIKYGAMIIN